jgi:hypothetical protein
LGAKKHHRVCIKIKPKSLRVSPQKKQVVAVGASFFLLFCFLTPYGGWWHYAICGVICGIYTAWRIEDGGAHVKKYVHR